MSSLLRWMLEGALAVTIAYYLRFELSLPSLFWERAHWSSLAILLGALAYLVSESSLSRWLRLVPSSRVRRALLTSIAYLPVMLLSFLSGGSTLPRSIAIISWTLHLIIDLFIEFLSDLSLIASLLRERKEAILVTDEPRDAEALKRYLMTRGYEVLEVISPDELKGAHHLITDDKVIILSSPNLLSNLRVQLPSKVLVFDVRGGEESLREPSFNDLIGRREREIDWSAIAEELAGKRVMVTGCAGTIGGAVLRKLIQLNSERNLNLRILGLDLSEGGIFKLKRELNYEGLELRLGDVRDKAYMRKLLKSFKPHLIIHSAAYKHVPILEEEPYQAIVNDFLATHWLVQLLNELNLDTHLIFISTDKAVNPLSNLGVAKRLAEISVLTSEGGGKRIVLRFGNVLGSSGSVLRIFEDCLERGEPLPITSDRAERYFMSLSEASELILSAITLPLQKAVVILDMGEPVKIIDLARRFLKLRGYNPDEMMRFIGLRPGEKLREELWYSFEKPQREGHFLIARYDERILEALTSYLREALKLTEEMRSCLRGAEDVAERLKRVTENLNVKAGEMVSSHEV